MKSIPSLIVVLVFSTAFAVAQGTMGRPAQTTPPTFPTQQQQPGMQIPPDQNVPANTPSATDLAKAQTDIQSAIRSQMPSLADSVHVAATKDNKIKLTGTVSSESEKKQVAEIAHSAAPDLKIVNKVGVAAPAGNENTQPVSSPGVGTSQPQRSPGGMRTPPPQMQ